MNVNAVVATFAISFLQNTTIIPKKHTSAPKMVTVAFFRVEYSCKAELSGN